MRAGKRPVGELEAGVLCLPFPVPCHMPGHGFLCSHSQDLLMVAWGWLALGQAEIQRVSHPVLEALPDTPIPATLRECVLSPRHRSPEVPHSHLGAVPKTRLSRNCQRPNVIPLHSDGWDENDRCYRKALQGYGSQASKVDTGRQSRWPGPDHTGSLRTAATKAQMPLPLTGWPCPSAWGAGPCVEASGSMTRRRDLPQCLWGTLIPPCK